MGFGYSYNDFNYVSIIVLIVDTIVSFSIENYSNHKNIENDYQSISLFS
jgi:hypothetical protein